MILKDRDHMAEAARRTATREEMSRKAPEPSLGNRLGQIGILGWAIVMPMLIGIFLGRMADRGFSTGIFFTAPAILIGAAIGFYSAWKWMHRQ
ncbi:AtpZ/AtpI family protein [Breoghania sp.]|uniref:AtpZ/AtpI family protein n=1 Tax=Breoghania sp. TaxID=2065378 RepID=UPI0029C9BC1F|nr:AtpZ/AtpI family protein [Breoghania sp.]